MEAPPARRQVVPMLRLPHAASAQSDYTAPGASTSTAAAAGATPGCRVRMTRSEPSSARQDLAWCPGVGWLSLPPAAKGHGRQCSIPLWRRLVPGAVPDGVPQQIYWSVIQPKDQKSRTWTGVDRVAPDSPAGLLLPGSTTPLPGCRNDLRAAHQGGPPNVPSGASGPVSARKNGQKRPEDQNPRSGAAPAAPHSGCGDPILVLRQPLRVRWSNR